MQQLAGAVDSREPELPLGPGARVAEHVSAHGPTMPRALISPPSPRPRPGVVSLREGWRGVRRRSGARWGVGGIVVCQSLFGSVISIRIP